MDCTEHEVRSAVTHLYAKLGPALKDCEGCGSLLQDMLLPKLLEKAEDMDFQVRRVYASRFNHVPSSALHDMILNVRTVGKVLFHASGQSTIAAYQKFWCGIWAD